MSPMLAVNFGLPGHLELLIVAFVILLLFGHRLPSVMASLGKGISVFRRAVSEGNIDGDDGRHHEQARHEA